MNRINALGLAVLVMLALGATIATSAFAEEEINAEWQHDTLPIESAMASTTAIELLLEETSGGVAASVLCKMLLDGTVGPGMDGSITKVLNNSGEEISELETGLGLVCEARETCEDGPDVEFRPEKLPWETLVDLMMPSGKFLNILHPSFNVTCLVLGGVKVTEYCLGLTSAELVNENLAHGVEEIFSKAAGTEVIECLQGGDGVIETDNKSLITLNNGETLTVD
jgi:hypothetical protein